MAHDLNTWAAQFEPFLTYFNLVVWSWLAGAQSVLWAQKYFGKE